ncbi:MAG TPA: hypothetical protein VFK74_06235, partial [Azospira sp.]|nr:hypothetical protein [Azospira sp.]
MKSALWVSLLLAATAGLHGCAVEPVSRPYPYYDEPVMMAPPPPRVEYIGAPPTIGYVWIGGYWNWVGVRYTWVSGRWEAPRPGYVWAPHRWERDGDRWRHQGGQWERQGDGRRWDHDGRSQGRPIADPGPRPERRFDAGPAPLPPAREERRQPQDRDGSPRFEREGRPNLAPAPTPAANPGPTRIERQDGDGRSRGYDRGNDMRAAPRPEGGPRGERQDGP